MATHVWKGGSGLWTDPTQWLPSNSGVPKSGDFAIISAGTVTTNSVTLSAEAVTLSGSAPVVITSTGLYLDAATTLDVANLANPQIHLDRTTDNEGYIDLQSSSILYVGYYGNAAHFLQNGTLEVDASSSIYFQSSQDTLANTGAINVGTSGVLSFYDNGTGNTLVNTGTIEVDSQGQASTIRATVTGVGSIVIGDGASLLLRAVGSGETLSFLTGNGNLILDGSDLTGNLFGAQIAGFGSGNTIDLGTNLVNSTTYDPGTQILTTYYNGIATGTLTFTGSYQNSDFSIDNSGPTTLLSIGGPNSGTACFAAGTRISTARGWVAVEDLRPGDIAHTLGRRPTRPIVWIGHRTVDCRRHPRPRDVMPIRVAAHAFGTGQPERELRLSPDHAVHLGHVLIPIRCLVNDATVAQEEVDRVTYYHVELDEHDVLLADGLPCESYLDTGNRSAFANGGPSVVAHPDFARAVWECGSCAPLMLVGPLVTAARKLLLGRLKVLGRTVAGEPDLTLVCDGHVVRPQRRGDTFRFFLPNPCRDVRLRSRVAVVPWDDRADHRRPLGVAVIALYLDGRSVPAGDPRRCEGWHLPDPDAHWTDGNARVDVDRASVMTVKVAAGQHYIAESETRAAPVRRSA